MFLLLQAEAYCCCCQAVAYGARHIVESLDQTDEAPVSQLVMCGGFTKNNLFLREHANIVALPVVLCEEPEVDSMTVALQLMIGC